MSEANIITEITQMMTDKKTAQNDINEATNLVMEMFKKKYINRLHEAAHMQRINAQKNPTKEIRLLHSIKPFLDESRHESIDKMIDTMTMLAVMQNIGKELSAAGDEKSSIETASVNGGNDNDSIHADGVYDIDEACMTSLKSSPPQNRNKLFELMFLLMLQPTRY